MSISVHAMKAAESRAKASLVSAINSSAAVLVAILIIIAVTVIILPGK